MACVLQLQTLLLETNEDANDLKDGDSGIDGRSVRRRATVRGRKRKRGLRSYTGYEWTEEEEEAFEVEAVFGKVVADGQTACANQGTSQQACSTASCCEDDTQHTCSRCRKDVELIDIEQSKRMRAA
eukprot:4909414-Pleurochrysis_carterae.AAC.4